MCESPLLLFFFLNTIRLGNNWRGSSQYATYGELYAQGLQRTVGDTVELVQKGGRPVKTLTPDQIEEVYELAAVLNKSQLAEYFGMTEKTFCAV